MRYQDEDDEADDIDPEAPDESDMDPDDIDDDAPDEVPCPYCGKLVAEFAEICPHCRSYISDEDAPRKLAPIWKWGIVLMLIAAFAGIVHFSCA